MIVRFGCNLFGVVSLLTPQRANFAPIRNSVLLTFVLQVSHPERKDVERIWLRHPNSDAYRGFPISTPLNNCYIVKFCENRFCISAPFAVVEFGVCIGGFKFRSKPKSSSVHCPRFRLPSRSETASRICRSVSRIRSLIHLLKSISRSTFHSTSMLGVYDLAKRLQP